MAKRDEQDPGIGWFSRRDMAAIFDVSEQHFDRSLRPLATADATKTVNRRPYFHARTLLNAWAASQAPKPAEIVTDPLLAGGQDSPSLERYRLARAVAAETDNEERFRRLVRAEVIRQALLTGITALRDAGHRLGKIFGNEASEIYNEGVAEFEAGAIRALGNAVGSHPDPQPGGAPAGAAAPDA